MTQQPSISDYLLGIDVSHFQGVIDWQKVKAAGIGFAFIKATDGVGFVDPQLNYNALACQALGLPFGFYHFFRPDLAAQQQAEYFLAKTKIYHQTLPSALDLEIGPVTTKEVAIWLDIVDEDRGREPLVYISPEFAASQLVGVNEIIDLYPVWVAEYTTRSTPTIPNGWSDWEFWQHMPSGTVDGVPNLVDLDRFHGTSEDLSVWMDGILK